MLSSIIEVVVGPSVRKRKKKRGKAGYVNPVIYRDISINAHKYTRVHPRSIFYGPASLVATLSALCSLFVSFEDKCSRILGPSVWTQRSRCSSCSRPQRKLDEQLIIGRVLTFVWTGSIVSKPMSLEDMMVLFMSTYVLFMSEGI